jgi:hypothetical protein
MDFLGSAAFSRAVQALDTKTGMLVCLKIIKVWMRWSLQQSHICSSHDKTCLLGIALGLSPMLLGGE